MANLHAEAYSGGALKHGPFALIDDENGGKFGATPIIMIILDDQHAHHMRTACEEVGQDSLATLHFDGLVILKFLIRAMLSLVAGQGAWSGSCYHNG